MKLKSQITVLAAKRYNMVDEKNGELVQGIKLTYVDDWNGTLEQNASGLQVLSATMPYDTWDGYSQLPALYDAEFSMAAGARGKPMLKITDLKYAQPFKPFGIAK